MAKAAVKEKEVKSDKADEYRFGVEDLADELGIEPASARIKLRNANIKKAPTGRYGWKTKAEVAELAEKLGSKKEKAAPKGKAKEEAAPAKKASGKKK